jgi:uncharacterized protein YqeY
MTGSDDPAEALKARIREDLKSAMQRRNALETGVLRGLIAALDNAQAIPVGDAHDKYEAKMFGDPGAEVPRRELSEADVRAVLEREAATRLDAAQEVEGLGQDEWAAKLREEAAIVARYVES